MASLITFPIDLTRTAAALEGCEQQLYRIAAALERLAPEVTAARPSHVAGLGDLRRTDPLTIAAIKEPLQHYAENNGVVVDSEAFLQSIIEYERQVGQAYGPEAINELPWNKAAGGTIFQSHPDTSVQDGAGITKPETRE